MRSDVEKAIDAPTTAACSREQRPRQADTCQVSHRGWQARLIKIPDELDLLHEYWPPDLGGLYWVNAEVFGRPDAKPKRPYVVIALPDESRPNDLQVVRRSRSAGHGVAHEALPEFGLDAGWFCELRNVSTELWTLKTVESIGHVLSEQDLAWVMGMFL